MTPRRARLVLVLVVLAAITITVALWQPTWVTTNSVEQIPDREKRLVPATRDVFGPPPVMEPFVTVRSYWEKKVLGVPRERAFHCFVGARLFTERHGTPTRGYRDVIKDGDWFGVSYYVYSGFKANEAEVRRNFRVQGTWWNSDGTVRAQMQWCNPPTGELMWRDSPPWLWNVTDQTAPSMPAWMQDDEKWQRALDAQD